MHTLFDVNSNVFVMGKCRNAWIVRCIVVPENQFSVCLLIMIHVFEFAQPETLFDKLFKKAQQ